jgi:hypothetical protein
LSSGFEGKAAIRTTQHSGRTGTPATPVVAAERLTGRHAFQQIRAAMLLV